MLPFCLVKVMVKIMNVKLKPGLQNMRHLQIYLKQFTVGNKALF